MKDIDFDELDKAVSSLMGDVSDGDDNTNSAVTKADDTSDTTATDDVAVSESDTDSTSEVVDDTADETSTTAEVEEPATTPKVVQQRRGKFMDVVRTPTTGRPPVTKSVASKPVIAPSADFASAIEEESANSDNELELAQEPAQSPFLPDAKVEKRPLGGASSTDPIDEHTPTEISSPDTDIEPTTTSNDADVTQVEAPAQEVVAEDAPANDDVAQTYTPVPAELGSDILNVELGSAPSDDGRDGNDTKDEAANTEAETTAPGSIPQQYKTAKANGEVEHAPLYAAQADIAPEATKSAKHGTLVAMLLLVLLLLVGAAGGYIAWTMGIFR